MTGFDYIVLLIIGISIVVSMMRGAVREVLALAGWLRFMWQKSMQHSLFPCYQLIFQLSH